MKCLDVIGEVDESGFLTITLRPKNQPGGLPFVTISTRTGRECVYIINRQDAPGVVGHDTLKDSLQKAQEALYG